VLMLKPSSLPFLTKTNALRHEFGKKFNGPLHYFVVISVARTSTSPHLSQRQYFLMCTLAPACATVILHPLLFKPKLTILYRWFSCMFPTLHFIGVLPMHFNMLLSHVSGFRNIENNFFYGIKEREAKI
jgi:hypothetical protein